MGNKTSKSESTRVSTRRQSPELVSADDVRRRDEHQAPDNEILVGQPPQQQQQQHPGTAKTCLVLNNFAAIGHNTVSVMKNEKVELIAHAQKWTEVYVPRLNQKGWIPSNYIAPLNSLSRYPWYHRQITRSKAEWLLRNGINGSFLVRESESVAGQYSLSVRHEGKKYHYRIQNHSGRFWINEESQFGTLAELIDHHSTCSSGLVTTLTHHVPNEVKPALDSLADEWEVDRNSITLGEKLGSGQYGEVYRGKWERSPGNYVTIAVKTLKGDSASQSEFMKETTLMKRLKHENLLNLLGVCTLQKPFFMITQFMPHGSLLDYLRKYKDQIMPEFFLLAASQIAAGMRYLEQESMVHRDLACRNCLVDENLTIRICDFGLSRLLGEEDSYTAREGTKFPIKWTAPEALHYNTFSTKSDVWSFGIVLWELASEGETPYPATDLQEVLTLLECGHRMPKPKLCPDQVYDLMKECWQWEPEDRPSFADIVATIENMFTSTSLEEEVERALKETNKNGIPGRPTFSPNLGGRSVEKSKSTADLSTGKGTPDPSKRMSCRTPGDQHPIPPARVKVPTNPGTPRFPPRMPLEGQFYPQAGTPPTASGPTQFRAHHSPQQAPWYPPQPIITNYPQAHIPNHPSNRQPTRYPGLPPQPTPPKHYPAMPQIPNYPSQKMAGPPAHHYPASPGRHPAKPGGPVKGLPQPITPKPAPAAAAKPRTASECSSKPGSDAGGSPASTMSGGDLLSELKSRQSKRNRNTEPATFCAVNPAKHAPELAPTPEQSPRSSLANLRPPTTTTAAPTTPTTECATGNGAVCTDENVNFKDILRGFQNKEQQTLRKGASTRQPKIT